MCISHLVVSDSLRFMDYIEHQAPLSIKFSRQEYCTGLTFPSPGYLPNPGTEPRSPAQEAGSLPSEHRYYKFQSATNFQILLGNYRYLSEDFLGGNIIIKLVFPHYVLFFIFNIFLFHAMCNKIYPLECFLNQISYLRNTIFLSVQLLFPIY